MRMKVLRTPVVFLCGALGALAISVLKAAIAGRLQTLPPWRVLVFAASGFGVVVALIDWLLRDIFSGKDRSKRAYRSEDPKRNEYAVGEVRVDSVSSKAIVQRARLRPVVFREICPPVCGSGLSFYGGVPIGPSHLVWPRCRNKAGGAPLTFIMQWNCDDLSSEDATGLIPRNGVLYLFADLSWGEPFDFEFLHMPGPVETWKPLRVPVDLPPLFGTDGAYQIPYCSPEISPEKRDLPRLMPKWPFVPVAFDNPELSQDGFWQESEAIGEALLRVQNPSGGPSVIRRPNESTRPFARPFAAFPHDYAAIRVIASEVLRVLRRPQSWLLRELPDPEREKVFDRWRSEAKERYESAAAHKPEAKVDQKESDETWKWMEGLEAILRLSWGSLLERCANVSFGLGSEAIGAIPEDLGTACARIHALADAYLDDERPDRQQPDAVRKWEARNAAGQLKEVRFIHAPCPNHMFGPPSDVQGYVEESMGEWLLLLELSTHGSIGHYFGEGVLQFMIRPADLKDRRYEKVKLVASSY